MSDDERLLQILQNHGQKFMQSFDLPDTGLSGKRKAVEAAVVPSAKRARKLEDEWHGIQPTGGRWTSEDNDSNSELAAESSEFELEDDGFTAGGSIVSDEKTVVFSETKFYDEKASKASMKAFMSSKVSKLRDNGSGMQQRTKKETEGEEEERTNAENDALLHKLVHTQLLSTSLNPDLDMTPSHRRKALAGRLMEVAGVAKLGKGQKVLRENERNKAGKRVREGLAQRQKEREKQELEEAKNLGNYHPALKKLFGASDSTSTARSKSRGLKIGAGKFRKGVLQLSKQEIASVTGDQRHAGRRGHKPN